MTVSRVAFLSSEYPPHTHGGLGTTVEALSRFLTGRGVEVVVVLPESGGYAEPPPGVRLVPVPVRGASTDEEFWLAFCEAAAAVATAGDLPVDLVHCHDWMTTLGGLTIGRTLAVPVVLTVHLPQSAPGNVVLENVGLAGCDSVIVNSRAVRDELLQRGLREDFAVVRNGVDLARFAVGPTVPDRHRVLFVGRLVPQKGVDVLIRAFGAVLRRHPDAELTIVGDGPQRLYLERLSRFLGIRRHVTFRGWTTGDVLPSLYRSAALTVVPSLYEPFGLVALEAMASGRPVVAASVGGLAEIVDDGGAGFAVVPGDHLDLATRIAALIADPALAARMGATARARAEQFDWALVADETARLYELVAAGASRSAGPAAVDEVLAGAPDGLRERAGALLRRGTIHYGR